MIDPKCWAFIGVAAGRLYLLPVLSLACMWACLFRGRDAEGEFEASGAMKVWTITESLGLNFTYKVCRMLIGGNWNKCSRRTC